MEVIFIPGLLCTNQIWGQTNTIRDKYVCHDADTTGFESIEAMSDALIKNMPEGDVAIVGISMGGYVAIDAAIKLGNKLTKLILLNTTSNSVNQTTLKERREAMQLSEKEGLAKVIAMSQGICYFKPREEWLLLEKKMANEVGAGAYVRQQQAIIQRKNYSNLIKNITADTLIISGKNDQVISFEDSVYMTKHINNSSLVILNECGHLSTLEKGSVIARCVKMFLEDKR